MSQEEAIDKWRYVIKVMSSYSVYYESLKHGLINIFDCFLKQAYDPDSCIFFSLNVHGILKNQLLNTEFWDHDLILRRN